MPAPTNVADIIRSHARATPRAAAIIDGGHELSYHDFERAIGRAAVWLRAQGIAPGSVVGLLLSSTTLHFVAAYALARIGAVQLSLPRHETAEVREGLAKRYGAQTTLGEKDLQRAWLAPGAAADDAAVSVAGGDAPWKIVMTSGTTGAPKTVLQTHRMHIAWRELNQLAIPLAPGERYLAALPLDFFAGMRICTDVHWAGAAVILGEDSSTPQGFVDNIRRRGVTHLYLTPLHISKLLESLSAGAEPLAGAPRLRTGSMNVPQALRVEVMRRLTPNLVVAYGTNEAGSPFTTASGETLERFPDSVGFPVRGIEVRIVGEEGRPLPAGEVGEIAVRAPGVPHAYHDNPAASERTFRDGWYYPGDLGMLSAEGALYVKGRADDLMNFDGIKIYPAEIEAVLLEHPAIAEAAALPLDSATHQHMPAAAVVLREPLERSALERYCAERLGARAPRGFVFLPALPKNAAGKVVKGELVPILRRAFKHET